MLGVGWKGEGKECRVEGKEGQEGREGREGRVRGRGKETVKERERGKGQG